MAWKNATDQSETTLHLSGRCFADQQAGHRQGQCVGDDVVSLVGVEPLRHQPTSYATLPEVASSNEALAVFALIFSSLRFLHASVQLRGLEGKSHWWSFLLACPVAGFQELGQVLEAVVPRAFPRESCSAIP